MSELTRQAHVTRFLQKCHKENSLAHAYLFFGGDHHDQVSVSKFFAKLVLGSEEGSVAANLIDCNEHANVLIIKPEGQNIKKEQIVLLKSEASKTALEQAPKVYIIENADRMSIAATNSLLKFLEEPADNVYIVLTVASKELLLPTITSRTINLNFRATPLMVEAIKPEMLAIITQLELPNASPDIVLATNQSLLKEYPLEFLEAYQLYYQCVLDTILGTSREANHAVIDEESITQSATRNDVSACTNKIRAILQAKTELGTNLNVQLCFDRLIRELTGS